MMKRKWIFLFSLLTLLFASSQELRANYSYYEEEDQNENYTEAEDDAYISENLNSASNNNSTSTEEIANRISDEKTKLLELSENISVAIPLETESELEAMNVTREPAVLDPTNDQGYNQNDEQIENNEEDRSLFADEESDSVQMGSSAILKPTHQTNLDQSAPTYQKRKIRSR